MVLTAALPGADAVGPYGEYALISKAMPMLACFHVRIIMEFDIFHESVINLVCTRRPLSPETTFLSK